MTPGERAAKRYETLRGLAKLDGVATHDLGGGAQIRCSYRRVPHNHTLQELYQWRVHSGSKLWRKVGTKGAIDLIRAGYEARE